MPLLPRYEYNGPVDCTTEPDRAQLKGKSVIVTGGANGIGKEYVRAFAEAGAFVTLSDIDEENGTKLAAELGESATFVKCDITSWEDQVRMFNTAASMSPNHSCDIVIANAGISRGFGDSLHTLDDPDAEPVKPSLTVLDTNLRGTLYTWKLAVHFFRKQPNDESRDRAFLIMGSLTSYVDSPGNWEYTCSKYALRGLVNVVRRSSWDQGIRINLVAPYFIKSDIRTPEVEQHLRSKGIDFGLVEDCVKAMQHLACDQSINGHALIVVPRSTIKEGVADAELDDFVNLSHYRDMQTAVLGLFRGHWRQGKGNEYDR